VVRCSRFRRFNNGGRNRCRREQRTCGPGAGSSPAPLTPPQRAVVGDTDLMTRHIHVPDAVIDALPGFFSQREIVELTATFGGYNLLSRFLGAFAADPASLPVWDAKAAGLPPAHRTHPVVR